MSAPQSLLQAAANRLAARLGSGLADTAASLSLLAQDAPARLQQEFTLFWQEVEQEAARLDRQGTGGGAASTSGSSGSAAGRGVWSGYTPAGGAAAAASDPQEVIDALRAQVAQMARRLDASATPGSAAPSPASQASSPTS